MTFEEFQATGRETNDVGECLQDDSLTCVAGRIYADYLYIGRDGGAWWTLIGNREHRSASLPGVERVLYEFAVAEGIA